MHGTWIKIPWNLDWLFPSGRFKTNVPTNSYFTFWTYRCLVIFFFFVFSLLSLWLRVLRRTHTWIKSVRSLPGSQTVKYRGSSLFFHKKIFTAFFQKKISSMLPWTDILFVLNSPAFTLGREGLCVSPFLSIEIIKLRIKDCADISLRQLSL